MRRPEATNTILASQQLLRRTYHFFSLVILFQSTFVLIHDFSLMWTSKCSQQNSIDPMTFDFFSLNFFSLLFSVNTDRVCILVNFSFWFAPNLWCNIIKSVLLTTEYFSNSLLVWSHYVCRMKSSLIFVSVHAMNKFLVWAFFRCALTKLAQNISNFQWLVLSNRKV